MIERVTVDGYEFAIDYGEPSSLDDIEACHREDDNLIYPKGVDGDFFETSEGYAIRDRAFAEFERRWPSIYDELSEGLEGRYDPILDGDIKQSIEDRGAKVHRGRSAA
jgi:hypothetical protein